MGRLQSWGLVDKLKVKVRGFQSLVQAVFLPSNIVEGEFLGDRFLGMT